MNNDKRSLATRILKSVKETKDNEIKEKLLRKDVATAATAAIVDLTNTADGKAADTKVGSNTKRLWDEYDFDIEIGMWLYDTRCSFRIPSFGNFELKSEQHQVYVQMPASLENAITLLEASDNKVALQSLSMKHKDFELKLVETDGKGDDIVFKSIPEQYYSTVGELQQKLVGTLWIQIFEILSTCHNATEISLPIPRQYILKTIILPPASK